MKIRDGFVSNSSSSSFVCEICHAAQEISDSCAIEEVGFCECKNNHVICTEHLLDKNYIRDEDDDFTSSDVCPICQLKILPQWMFELYIKKRMKITPEIILKDVKSKFKNYNELKKYLGV